MTVDELKIMKAQMLDPFRYSKTQLWIDAFNEYNEDHQEDRPLHRGCRSCYYKVYKHLVTKYYSANIPSEPRQRTTFTK